MPKISRDAQGRFRLVFDVLLVPRLSNCAQERNGSSLQAITKVVGDKHPNLPGSWKKVLSNHVRKLKLSGKLIQVTPAAATQR